MSNKNFFLFSVILMINSILFYLSYIGLINIAHGPLYYFTAESLVENYSNFPNIFAIPKPSITPQVGISFIFAIFIFISKKYWFIFHIIFNSFVWLWAIKKINNYLTKLGISKLDAFIVSALIFLQPYNLNQIAAFSNESYYIPFLIICTLFLLEKIHENKNNKIIFFFKANYLIVFLFLVLGIFFRVHNLVLLASLILFFYINQDFFKFKIFAIITIFSLLIWILVTKNFFYNSYLNVIDLLVNAYQGFVDIDNLIEKNRLLPASNFITDKNIFVAKLNNSLSIFSFPLLIKKMSISPITELMINLFLMTFYFFFNSKYKIDKNLYKFSNIYIFLSMIFIFILPMYEYSYLLPVSFLIIINYYIIFKKIFKKIFYLIFTLSSVNLVIILFLIYTETIKIKKIEIYGLRENIYLINQLNQKYNKKNTLYYLGSSMHSVPEFYAWYFRSKICNNDLEASKCAKILKKEEIKNIIIITPWATSKKFDYKVIDIFQNYNKKYNRISEILQKTN